MAWSRRTTSAPLLEPKRNLDLLGGPNLWTRTEPAGVRSVFNDARASSLCLAPWDTRKSLNIFESLEIQQLQMIWNLPLDLEAILKVACRARRAKRLVSSWVPTPGAQLAAFRRIPRADAFRQKKHESRKLEPARNETSISSYLGFHHSESQIWLKSPEWWKESGCLKKEITGSWTEVTSYCIIS